VRRFRPENAIGIGLFIIPFTMLCIAVAPFVEKATGVSIHLAGLNVHPLILMLAIGIALQGLAECFLSPKFLEYASKQAPPGEVGLYLGYQHLTTFFAWLFGFILSGYLLNAYCPDPRHNLDDAARQEWRMATEPHYQFTMNDDETAALEGIAEGAEVQIPPTVQHAFAAHSIDVPSDAVVTRSDMPDWQVDPEDTWTVTWNDNKYEVQEDQLESYADAKKHGRTKALRDVVVYSPEARPRTEMGKLPKEYDHAHYIWFVFTGVGFVAFLALLVFKYVTAAIDRSRAREERFDAGAGG